LNAAFTPEERCGADAPTVLMGAADQTSTVGPVAGEACALLAAAELAPLAVAGVLPAAVLVPPVEEAVGLDEQAAKAHNDAAASTPVSAFARERCEGPADWLRKG
jgi:hypothetical protein